MHRVRPDAKSAILADSRPAYPQNSQNRLPLERWRHSRIDGIWSVCKIRPLFGEIGLLDVAALDSRLIGRRFSNSFPAISKGVHWP